ncbi:hypothetical protein Q3G72_012286 [Acer saccharum]|nr:hypothetical protein Q3G72_012286 [Acer saccharum]
MCRGQMEAAPEEGAKGDAEKLPNGKKEKKRKQHEEDLNCLFLKIHMHQSLKLITLKLLLENEDLEKFTMAL